MLRALAVATRIATEVHHDMTAPAPVRTSETRLSGDSDPIGSRCVRALLNRHDIPSARHVTTIGDILGGGYTPAYRRMNGTVAWEIEEVEKVAAFFGESLVDVFSRQQAADELPAMLVAGPIRLPCHLIPGNAVRDPVRNSLVAVRLGEQWLVVPATEAGVGQCFEVVSMRVLGHGDRRWRIAVLDDDAEESSSLAQHFSDRGCDVQAFTRVDDLVPSMKLRPFDGFVIDWMLSEGSAAELVGMIRADDRDCPIAVLTGKIRSDVMVEPAVAEAVTTYKLLFFEKPTRLPIISAQLLQALAGR
jgi:ActR/RegA family two-component response regulator